MYCISTASPKTASRGGYIRDYSFMNIKIFAKNMELTPSMEKLVEQKIAGSLARFLSSLDKKMDIVVDISVGKLTEHHKEGKVWFCDVTVPIPFVARPLHVTCVEESLEAAINEAKDELVARIKKFKEKKTALLRRSTRRLKHSI